MRESSPETRRQVRIERAVCIDRKEVREFMIKLENGGLVASEDTGIVGRGGHPIVTWNITEAGKMWRSDIGRFIQLGQRMEMYPEEFFYLPSDAI